MTAGRHRRGPLAWLPFLLVAAAAAQEPALLTEVRQLTLAGRRAGEGYFSADGRWMVFQSEREPGNPFFQIYLMDLRTGAVRRLSPGVGKTTCAWFRPPGREVLFASTHLDPEARKKQEAELAARRGGKGRRYRWDFDPHFDLFLADLATGALRRLTDTRGYDAEGSISPDGRWVVFASNRHAYADGDEAERRLLAREPGRFVDLYRLDLETGAVRRLTREDGYDGGPFFSPDGRRIVWRHFAPDGRTAEIYTMAADGTDVRQITRLGAMSWAPYYHPSGDYIIFSTSVHGFENFELYIVDAEGRHEPVRVTRTPGFDGLPVFLPDGRRLAWTSTRGGAKKGQIFLARWDDAGARRLLGLVPDPALTRAEVDARDLRLHVSYLASAPLAGRRTGTPGEEAAARYLARVFRHLGLEPAGEGGSYFQPFTFMAGARLGGANSLEVRLSGVATTLPLHEAWRPLAFSRRGEIPPTPVVFGGYGIAAPEAGYDGLAGLDVKGEWVLVLRGRPPGKEELERHARLRFKAMLLRDRGAVGILAAPSPTRPVAEELVPFGGHGGAARGMGIACVSITRAVAARLLGPAGKDLGRVAARLDRGGIVNFPLPRVTVRARIDIERIHRTGRNVVGRLRAPAPEAVLIGAHYDHLGRGPVAGSRARPEEREGIHYGADDNASGVAGVLEVVQWLAGEIRAGRLQPRRDLLVAAWSGEELGLLGSAHFVAARNPGSPPRIVAALNLDMIGRFHEAVTVQGIASSSRWAALLEAADAPVGLPLRLSRECYLPTDATSFYRKGVPVLSFFTGTHEDYHTPRDTWEKLDYGAAARVARLVARVTTALLTAPAAPDYIRVEAKPRPVRRVGIVLGTLPDYGEAPIPGLRLQGVRKGLPADKAGLRGGDVIVELAGHKVENIYDFMNAMSLMEPGRPYPVVVVRGDRRLRLTIVPVARD